MGLDLTVYDSYGKHAQEVDTRRGNVFVAAYRHATGINLIEGIDADEWHMPISNKEMKAIVQKMNDPFIRMSMVLCIEGRGSMSLVESIDFVNGFHEWFKTHSEAGHRIVVG